MNTTIAILGRPNVGKSTLFNRLLGQRKSIVAPIEGVTRDRIYAKVEWLDKEFNLIDTGGYLPKSENLIDKKVKLQSEIASEQADILMLVVDGRSEITSSDRALAKMIKKTGKPCLLVINKVDNPENEINTFDFYELGINKQVCISAHNGRQIGVLLDEISLLLPNVVKKNINEKSISFAIIGMPNVGKSSLMNTLINENKSIVTNIAGTTRDSIDSYLTYFKNSIRIIDTAGLRKKSKIDDSLEFYSNVRTLRVIDECDIAAVLIDINKGFNNQDKNIIRYVIDQGRGLIIVINKWDLVSKQTNTMKDIKEDMIYEYPYLKHYPIIFISVKEKFRINDVLKNVLEISNKTKNKIKTSELNTLLEKITKYYPPPAVKGKEIKLNYITQVSQSPVVFNIFVNHPALIPIQYTRYLDNQLRTELDLKGLPIKISFKKK